MRINVYSQELIVPLADTDETRTVERLAKTADTGIVYHAVRQFLLSPEALHDHPGDDDRSAITWWLPRTPIRRERLARQFEELARLVREAPSETGLD